MKKTVTIKMTEDYAYAAGLLRCTCFHQISGHLVDNGKTTECAFCDCAAYDEVASVGEIVARAPMKYRRDDVLMAKDGSLWEIMATVPKTMSYMLYGRDQEHGHGVMSFADDANVNKMYEKIGRL